MKASIRILLAVFLLVSYILPVYGSEGNPSGVMNIAHRGASAYAPENTIAAFDKALAMKADYIELGIHRTKDKKLIVMHDKKINRTTNGKGYIKNYTLKKLKKLDAGSWYAKKFSKERVPTLAEVLKKYSKKVGIIIEIKEPQLYPGIEKQLANEIRPYLSKLSKPNIKVQSFDIKAIERFHFYIPSIPSGVVFKHPISEQKLNKISHFADFINIKHNFITKNLIKDAHFLGMMVIAWSVDTGKVVKSLFLEGVDGIIADYPELAIKKMKV